MLVRVIEAPKGLQVGRFLIAQRTGLIFYKELQMLRRELKTRKELLESKKNCENKAKSTDDFKLKTFYLNAAKGFKIRSNALIVLRG